VQMTNKQIKHSKQDVLIGSSQLHAVSTVKHDRLAYVLNNMEHNKSFISAAKLNRSPTLLAQYQDQFANYRKLWFEQQHIADGKGLTGAGLLKNGLVPLCVDVETAAICDLACKFCFRDTLATPDKIMDEQLFKRIVDQAVDLGVPSMKFNWRGEPLMNPKLPKFIEYAKNKGILDTIINTNATHLDKSKSRDLINAGLDFMIYSFDGGTKETYETMRPGRFKHNSFDNVYSNIEGFHEVRQQMGAKFPYTKIQMILTDKTYREQESFYSLFNDCVDEVTVTQYSERGGNFEDLTEVQKSEYTDLCNKLNLPPGTAYLRDSEGNVSVSKKRKPCEQPYQRLLITYDGRVAMCCYDWGAMHPVGYVSDKSFENENADKDDVLRKIKDKRKGFEMLTSVRQPPKFNNAKKIVESLGQIWEGEEISDVRLKHVSDRFDCVKICKGCSFKDTYDWSN
jgi:MoaA/NifB/PqqE/SkfB family radical SAM enzyme